MLDSTWLEAWKLFLGKVSSENEEPAECKLEFKLTEVPRLRETSALGGKTLMDFLGRKREKDLGFPEYWEPQPSDGSLPDKRLLARKD